MRGVRGETETAASSSTSLSNEDAQANATDATSGPDAQQDVKISKKVNLIKTETEEAEGATNPEEAAQIFSALVPQTSTDLISESRSLFARILADQPHPSLTTKVHLAVSHRAFDWSTPT